MPCGPLPPIPETPLPPPAKARTPGGLSEGSGPGKGPSCMATLSSSQACRASSASERSEADPPSLEMDSTALSSASLRTEPSSTLKLATLASRASRLKSTPTTHASARAIANCVESAFEAHQDSRADRTPKVDTSEVSWAEVRPRKVSWLSDDSFLRVCSAPGSGMSSPPIEKSSGNAEARRTTVSFQNASHSSAVPSSMAAFLNLKRALGSKPRPA
mmetsp:Transcript_25145/g.70288  ORF Transcript_25145/g.70288 Transcript_25145/m.70288 type:complete len:217 (+) Transcript_25145:67-717(+)